MPVRECSLTGPQYYLHSRRLPFRSATVISYEMTGAQLSPSPFQLIGDGVLRAPGLPQEPAHTDRELFRRYRTL